MADELRRGKERRAQWIQQQADAEQQRRIGEATQGRSIPANLSLAENNAGVAAQIAVAIAEQS